MKEESEDGESLFYDLDILIIDDEESDRVLVRNEIEKVFPDCEITETGTEKELKDIDYGDFDVIITDYRLRWNNGLDILKDIKKGYPDKPVIMFTGTGNEEVAVKAMRNGLDDYVIKTVEHYKRLPASIRMALKRKKEREEKKRAEEKFKVLFNNLTIGVYRTTPDGEILVANPALIEMLGYESPDELKERNLEDGGFEPGYSREEFKKELEDEDQIIGLESAWKRRDGTTLYIRENAKVVRDENGGVKYYEGSVEDITGIKKEVEREDFLHSLLRHDLKNKSQIALGYLELLRDADDPSEREQFIQKSEKAIKNGIELIEKVRTLREIEKGDDIEEVDVQSVIKNVLSDHQQKIEEKDIDIELEGEDVKVLGGVFLEELFSNCIKNSLAHSNCENIMIDIEENKNTAEIRIRDDGEGIPERIKDKIFEKGIKGTGSQGFGLGMYLCKRIVDEYGGDIKVESADSDGTTIIITLPKV